MPRFNYRFESILRLHEQIRDEARLQLAQAREAMNIIQQQIDEIVQRRQQARQANRQNLIGTISVDNLLDQGRFDVVLEGQERGLQEKLAQIEQEIERRAHRLTLAEQEYRKFEKLKEIARQQHDQEALRVEQVMLDEIASRRSLSPPGDF